MRTLIATMVYNERQNLEKWIDYYGGQLGYESLVIFDHGSDDFKQSELPEGVSYLKVPRDKGFSDASRAYAVSRFCDFFLEFGDWFIYTDCDELIAADPRKFSSLSDFLYSYNDGCDVIMPLGFDVVHNQRFEDDLDRTLNYFQQRSYLRYKPEMCKPVIVRSKTNWGPGFHASSSFPHVSEELFLMHTKNIDIKSRLARQKVTRSIDNTDGVGHGGHYKWSDGDVMKAFESWQNHKAVDFYENLEEIYLFSKENIENFRPNAPASQHRYRVNHKLKTPLMNKLYVLPGCFGELL